MLPERKVDEFVQDVKSKTVPKASHDPDTIASRTAQTFNVSWTSSHTSPRADLDPSRLERTSAPMSSSRTFHWYNP